MIQSQALGRLELLTSEPSGEARPTPLLFVHGAFSGAWIWADNFLPWFAERGFRAYALSLRGHGRSDGHDTISWHSIASYVEDVEKLVYWLNEDPVLIGHSMGGFVVQKYLERHRAPAVVLLSSAPPQGLLAAQVHLFLKRSGSLSDLNRAMTGHYAEEDVLRELLFAQPVDPAVVRSFASRMQPESQRAIWDMSMFNPPRLPTKGRPPMLILGGEKDALIPAFLVQSTARTYGLPARIFRGMGHALMHERDWQVVAAAVEDWLTENGF